jgi:hypothetical protein
MSHATPIVDAEPHLSEGNETAMKIRTRKRPKRWLADSPGKRCPNCGERSGRPIVRGMPTNEVDAAAEHGTIDVFLDGCIVGPDDAKYHCSNCATEFG